MDEGLDKAGDFADDKTGGRFSDQIEQGKDAAAGYLGADEDGDKETN